jgi:hypothetical protein
MAENIKKTKTKNRWQFFVLAGFGLVVGLAVLYYYRQLLINSSAIDESLLSPPKSSQNLGIRIDNKQKEKVSQFNENKIIESKIEVGNPEPFLIEKK